ncbi:hypothetical protein PAI11_07280 [Patulibacter medicamentivorans]|uniref:Uncharacterized protein n=1 Tax=Patulibacter medicamentivorans TaxID=1097667 RepID=H0E1R6_9ACTN|nr:hypothetical protein [Patulibacter medicamentivorans]EHN12367.1 hypothetical protein PAI11_07280 [Patulibacter medicamentivorans]
MRSLPFARRARRLLVAGACLAAVAGGPAVAPAAADDLTLVKTVNLHAQRLEPRAKTLSTALQRYGKAPTDRARADRASRAAGAVRREVDSFRAALRYDRSNSAEGRALRTSLLRALWDIRSGTGTLESGLARVARRAASLATLRSLQAAQKTLERGLRNGEKAVRRILAAT